MRCTRNHRAAGSQDQEVQCELPIRTSCPKTIGVRRRPWSHPGGPSFHRAGALDLRLKRASELEKQTEKTGHRYCDAVEKVVLGIRATSPAGWTRYLLPTLQRQLQQIPCAVTLSASATRDWRKLYNARTLWKNVGMDRCNLATCAVPHRENRPSFTSARRPFNLL